MRFSYVCIKNNFELGYPKSNTMLAQRDGRKLLLSSLFLLMNCAFRVLGEVALYLHS